MQQVDSVEAYTEYLRALGGWPQGFRGFTQTLSFVPPERNSSKPFNMNLAAILPDQPITAFSAVFTRNAFPGAPVRVGRRIASGPATAGILVNNKISNVCSPSGEQDIATLQEVLAAETGRLADQFFCISTGIIGWQLPAQQMAETIPSLLRSPAEPADVAAAIMTTDRYPKLRVWQADGGSIVGLAKGAGMIEPNMATMLVFLLTDFNVSRDVCGRALRDAVENSFNRISVDSDQSTSDSALLLSSQAGPQISEQDFSAGLQEVCSGLADDIVRNGEGIHHVITVDVRGAADKAQARACGKAVVNSPLVKTAVCGNDPNVGRIVAALGDYCGNAGIELDPCRVSIAVDGERVFADGAFALSPELEKRLSERFQAVEIDPCCAFPQHQESVSIEIDLGLGQEHDTVKGADLTHEYIHENADYRT